jgi:hypothetical protein
MNVLGIILILLVLGAFGGSFAGWYPHTYGFGGGSLLLVLLVVLLMMGRL